MAFLDGLTNKATIASSDSSTSADDTGAGSPSVPGSGDSIRVIGGNKIDCSFLDALYAANKITPSQRDAILRGGDVTIYGLSDYDLYYLTVGRLGSKSATCCNLPNIAAFSATRTYQQGELVTYQLAGGGIGLYQAQSVPPQGTLPLNATYWLPLTTPSAQVLYDADVVSPALASLAAPSSGILGLQSTAGTSITGVTVPAGRSYKVSVSEPRPGVAGGGTPTDSTVKLVPIISEQVNADLTRSLTIIPSWKQTANANNASIAAVAAGGLAVRLTITLQ